MQDGKKWWRSPWFLAVAALILLGAGFAAGYLAHRTPPAETKPSATTQPATQTGTEPEPTSLQEVTAVMAFIPLSYWNPVYVAMEKGYFAEENLHINLQYAPEGSFGAIKQVGAGQASFALASGDAILKARDQGIPVVAVYQMSHANTYSLITSPTIQSLSAMRGKTIAIAGFGSPTELVARGILDHAGVSQADVQFVAVGTAIVQTLLAGKADAIGGAIEHELLAKAGNPDVKIYRGADYGANFVGLCVLTNEELATSDPDGLVERFLRAFQKGLQFATDSSHLDEATDIFIDHFNPDAASQRQLHRTIWREVVSADILPRSYSLGGFNWSQWDFTAAELLRLGILQKAADLYAAANPWYLKKL